MSREEPASTSKDLASESQQAGERVSLRALAGVFFRIGVSSLGGGTMSWIHRETVLMRGWLSTEEFMAGMSLGQVLPGANVSNMAVYVGNRLRGALGAIFALLGLLSGPFVLILLLVQASAHLEKFAAFDAALDGVAAAAVGLVLNVGVVSARLFMPRLAPALVMIATFIAIAVLHLSLFLTVAVLAPISVGFAYLRRRGV